MWQVMLLILISLKKRERGRESERFGNINIVSEPITSLVGG